MATSGGTLRRGLRSHWAAPVAMAIAIATRLPGLGHPSVLVFDEQYYVPGAAEMLQWGAAHGVAKHPPLGWWLIAAGIKLFGFTPFGWRSGALVAGVATVGVVCATVRRLTRSDWLAFLAGLFCALDGIMFTMGRLGMLDAFVGLFVSLIVWALVVMMTTPTTDRRRQRRFAILALVAVGLGAATKWSVIPLVFVVLGVMWDQDRKLESKRRARAALVSVVLAVVIPSGIYVVSWLPRQAGPDAFTPSSFVHDQRRVLDFHMGLTPHDANAAPAELWFTMGRPARLFAQKCTKAAARTGVGPCRGQDADSGALLLALANPAVWTICLGGLGVLLWQALRRRRRIAVGLLAVILTQWLPWLINRRWAYSYYETAIIPTLIVAAAWGLGRRRLRKYRLSVTASVIVVVAMFVFFYPVWTAHPMSNYALGTRIWWWGWPD